jgi:hypothetical protein
MTGADQRAAVLTALYRTRSDWRSALMAVRRPVLPRRLALSGIGEVSIVWQNSLLQA